MVTVAAPGCAVVLSTVSIGPVTVSVALFEVPPPGAGVLTVIVCVAPDVKSDEGSVVRSSVAETNVVDRATPLTRMLELLVKFVPAAVSSVAPEPCGTDVGEIDVSVGAGRTVTVSVAPLDVPLAGV
jgi:hypothetical protein